MELGHAYFTPRLNDKSTLLRQHVQSSLHQRDIMSTCSAGSINNGIATTSTPSLHCSIRKATALLAPIHTFGFQALAPFLHVQQSRKATLLITTSCIGLASRPKEIDANSLWTSTAQGRICAVWSAQRQLRWLVNYEPYDGFGRSSGVVFVYWSDTNRRFIAAIVRMVSMIGVTTLPQANSVVTGGLTRPSMPTQAIGRMRIVGLRDDRVDPIETRTTNERLELSTICNAPWPAQAECVCDGCLTAEDV